MGLEVTTVPSGLVTTNPVDAADNVSTLGSQDRLIKTVVKNLGRWRPFEWSTQTGTSFTAVAGAGYVCTNVAAVTATLPASPSVNDAVGFLFTNGLDTNVLARNGSNIGSLAEDCTINSSALVIWSFVYVDATRGWIRV